MLVGMGSIPVCLSTSATPHVDSCSRKLIGEGNTQPTLWLTGKGMKSYSTRNNITEVDWGALHDSGVFFFFVNIDYDAKPKDFFTQELWGGLSERITSTTLRSLNHVEGKWVHHLELQTGPSRLDHQLDQQWDRTPSPCPQHESSYNTQPMGPWGEIIAPSTLQESYSIQDHLVAMDSI